MKPPKTSLPNPAPAKVFDVAKPGASTPSATTRPLIVTNRPIMQDPMVTPPSDESDVEATQPARAVPLFVDKKPIAVIDPGESPVDATQDASKPADKADEEEVTETSTEASLDQESPADPTTTTRKTTEAETRRQAEYEKIIASQKYFVPINGVQRKHTMRYAVAGAIIVILVALGCLDVMLDAGTLHLSGLPHTHFIK